MTMLRVEAASLSSPSTRVEAQVGGFRSFPFADVSDSVGHAGQGPVPGVEPAAVFQGNLSCDLRPAAGRERAVSSFTCAFRNRQLVAAGTCCGGGWPAHWSAREESLILGVEARMAEREDLRCL